MNRAYAKDGRIGIGTKSKQLNKVENISSIHSDINFLSPSSSPFKEQALPDLIDSEMAKTSSSTSFQLKVLSISAWITFLVVEGFRVFVEPLLCHLRILTPGFGDATYGRSLLPLSEAEKRLIYENPDVTAVTRKVELKSDAMRKGGSWDRPGINFVSYSTWQVDKAMEREKLDADIVLLHGINNYAGRQAEMGLYLCNQGFRVIAIDLPSFGRSTGLHCYLPSLRILVEAVHSVLIDIMKHDPPSMAGRKVFLQGESMGGFTALYYAALYPPLPKEPSLKNKGEYSKKVKENDAAVTNMRPNLAGVACAAPMLRISPQSRPGPMVEKIARVLAFFAGRMPFSPGVKGNVSDDIRVETEFHADAQTYKGWIRISTGLAILAGMAELWQLAPQITIPVTLHHGKNDRATHYEGTKMFYERINSKEKAFRLWDGYEHIMMKKVKGQSQADDDKRQAILDVIVDFYKTQARKGQ